MIVWRERKVYSNGFIQSLHVPPGEWSGSIDTRESQKLLKRRNIICHYWIFIYHFESFRISLFHTSIHQLFHKINQKILCSLLESGQTSYMLINFCCRSFLFKIIPTLFQHGQKVSMHACYLVSQCQGLRSKCVAAKSKWRGRTRLWSWQYYVVL